MDGKSGEVVEQFEMTLPSDFGMNVYNKHLHEFNEDKTMDFFHREMMLCNWCQILCMVGKKEQMGGIGPGRLQEQYFLTKQVEPHNIVGIQTKQMLKLKKDSVKWLWNNAKINATAFNLFKTDTQSKQGPVAPESQPWGSKNYSKA